MSARSRLRAALRREPRRLTAAERWSAYLAAVEPALAATPRVHRFAAVPVLGDGATPAAPLAVWVDERGGGDLDRSLRALAASTVAPAEILHGELPRVLREARAPHLLLLRAGDEPAPPALERLGQALTLAPDAHVLTCDEDHLDPSGSRGSPRVRPGPSPDRWLALDDSGSMLVVEREAALAGLGTGGAGGAGDPHRHELALRLAGPGGERHAHVPLILCHRGPEVAHEVALGPEPVSALLGGVPVEARGAGVRRVRWPLRGEPTVEVIVCFRDKPELLERCVGSLLADTAWERLSVALVDNGSVRPETARLVSRLEADGRVRVLRDDRPFNFAALNNLAARSSAADVLVFLNNDTEVIDGGWLATLLEEALRPEVGAVAPLLVYPDGRVQHAGAAIGLHGYAGHPFAGLLPSDATAFGRADEGTRNWLAVTAACLVVERWKFEAVGGFDEAFVVAGNDVDLCLRLTARGHRSLCVPHAVLVHDESRSRGAHIDPGDFVTSERSYGAFRTVGDPFYNPNLTLEGTDCTIRVPATGAAR